MMNDSSKRHSQLERLSLTLRGLTSVFSSLNGRVKIFVFVANSRRNFSIFM